MDDGIPSDCLASAGGSFGGFAEDMMENAGWLDASVMWVLVDHCNVLSAFALWQIHFSDAEFILASKSSIIYTSLEVFFRYFE